MNQENRRNERAKGAFPLDEPPAFHESFWIMGKGRIGRPTENGSLLLKAIMEMSAR